MELWDPTVGNLQSGSVSLSWDDQSTGPGAGGERYSQVTLSTNDSGEGVFFFFFVPWREANKCCLINRLKGIYLKVHRCWIYLMPD